MIRDKHVTDIQNFSKTEFVPVVSCDIRVGEGAYLVGLAGGELTRLPGIMETNSS
jgi:hypothetical protein